MDQRGVQVQVPVTGAHMSLGGSGKESWVGASEETPLGEVELVVEVPSVLVTCNTQRTVCRNLISPACSLAVWKVINKRRGRSRNQCSQSL